MIPEITNLPPRDHVFANGRRCCDDCKLAFRHEGDSLARAQMMVRAGPILHDDLWATIAHEDAFLCLDCIERRLGRPLTQADLIPCPWNAGWMSFDDADVAATQRARVRRRAKQRTFRSSSGGPRSSGDRRSSLCQCPVLIAITDGS